VSPHDIQVGDQLEPLYHTPTEVDLFLYSAALGTAHRIHYDRDFARSVDRLPDIVVHGPLQSAYLSELCCAWAASVDGRLESLEYRHVAAAAVGRTLICRGEVVEVGDDGLVRLDVRVEAEPGAETTTFGAAVIRCSADAAP
jgi:hydroxyacyl-ACP dehydratase HTD2-like protein with hotdog domain